MSAIDVRENYQHSKLLKELGITNIHQLPKISKVTVGVGIAKVRQTKEMVDYIEKALAKITGSAPIKTRAKRSIAGFKVRAGETIGFKVTLRGRKMNDFLNRLINISIPRLRDFRGFRLSSLDQQGNLTIGLRDQGVFPELGSDSFERPFGLQVTVVIDRSDRQKSGILLKQLGFPPSLG